jgi:hypothetical protein
MNDCQRADYLILIDGGSVRRLNNFTKVQAISSSYSYSEDHKTSVTLVEVIGEVRLEARWVDAKEQTK